MGTTRGRNGDTYPGRGSVIGDDDLRVALTAWDLATIVSVRRHGHGLNSATWRVAADRGAWIGKAMPAFVRFRWAVRADYFARRIAARDGTGLDDPAENEQGLAQAHRHLIV